MRLVAMTLIFWVAALSALGMVILFSASTGQPAARYLIMQPIWCGVGLIAFFAGACSNYRWFKKHPSIPWVLFGVAVLLLGLVLVPSIGLKVNGARRWLGLGQVRLQPSEFAKLAVIVVLAWYGERYQRFMGRFFRGLIIPGAIIAPVLGLIFLEPDVGTAAVLGAVSAILLLIAGIRWTYFLPPVFLVVTALAVFIWQNPMRSERVYSWLHLEETKQDKGLQAYQALVALGSGGVTGVGLADGRQKLGFVPEHHTDFILSVIGEELGLAATLTVVAGFLSILICGVYIAWHARDTFGMLLASGITFLISLQAVINIGVVTGSLPNKGLSLPFISYGGSNLVAMFACVGLLISIARQASKSMRSLHACFEDSGLAVTHLL
jgi:cell division protein FtsW